MTIDRDLFIDTFYNVASFEKSGLDMATGLSTAVRCDSPGWWLDPKGKDFGPNAKYFKYDLAEAKKLRPYAEKLITKAKRGGVHRQRQVVALIHDQSAASKLFTEIAPLMAEREGGQQRNLVGGRSGVKAEAKHQMQNFWKSSIM
jgi:hypothetical protein